MIVFSLPANLIMTAPAAFTLEGAPESAETANCSAWEALPNDARRAFLAAVQFSLSMAFVIAPVDLSSTFCSALFNEHKPGLLAPAPATDECDCHPDGHDPNPYAPKQHLSTLCPNHASCVSWRPTVGGTGEPSSVGSPATAIAILEAPPTRNGDPALPKG